MHSLRRAIVLLALLVPLASAGAAEPASMSARIDGKSWRATRTMAVTFRFGPSPAINIAAYLDGPPTSKFNFNLVLGVEDDFLHGFTLAPARARTSHAAFLLNVMTPEASDTVFDFDDGELIVTAYDADAQTISGSFAGRATNPARTRTIEISDGRFANIKVLVGP